MIKQNEGLFFYYISQKDKYNRLNNGDNLVSCAINDPSYFFYSIPEK